MPVHFFMTIYLGVPMSLVLLHPSPVGGEAGRVGAYTTNPAGQVAGRKVSPEARLALCAGVPTLPFGVPERTERAKKHKGLHMTIWHARREKVQRQKATGGETRPQRAVPL